jgi:hypothetical protein
MVLLGAPGRLVGVRPGSGQMIMNRGELYAHIILTSGSCMRAFPCCPGASSHLASMLGSSEYLRGRVLADGA